jgi:hypothetical protein
VRIGCLIVILLVCVLPQAFPAQQAPAPTPGVIRINVDLVQVDAVVTDASGKPVTNLKAGDFEVLQDGKVQRVRNFEFVRVKDTLGSMTVRPGSLLPVGVRRRFPRHRLSDRIKSGAPLRSSSMTSVSPRTARSIRATR